MKKPWTDKETLQEAYYRLGSQSKVADEFGCSGATISRWLNEFEIDKSELKPYLDKETLQNEYERLGNMHDVAEYFGCSITPIHKWIHEFGIDASEPTGEDRENWIERISVECRYCNSEFKVPPYKQDVASFCGLECKGNWMSENWVGEDHPSWKDDGGFIDYGKSWSTQRRKVRKRDGNVCQRCGSDNGNQKPDVHHIIPFNSFNDSKKANQLENLVQLCSSCHKNMEAKSAEKQREILNLN